MDIVRKVEDVVDAIFDPNIELTPNQKAMIELYQEEERLTVRNRELNRQIQAIRNLPPRHVEANARRSTRRSTLRTEHANNMMRLEEIAREREGLTRH